MLQHAIAPTRFFSQTPNDIIRHPRLNSLAVRLLQCALCRDPLPPAQTTGICTPCTGVAPPPPPQPAPLAGPALARAALGPRVPRRRAAF
jgi:hypothetical protein